MKFKYHVQQLLPFYPTQISQLNLTISLNQCQNSLNPNLMKKKGGGGFVYILVPMKKQVSCWDYGSQRMKGLLSSLPGTRQIIKQCLYSELPGIFSPRGCFLNYSREPPYKMIPNIQASTDGLFRSNSDDKFTFNKVPLGFHLQGLVFVTHRAHWGCATLWSCLTNPSKKLKKLD